MEQYKSIPNELVDGWVSEDVRMDPDEVPLHYHKVEECLEVREGKITFFSAGDKRVFALGEGQEFKALKIPRGEVHRVVIGGSGVTYRMWTPVPLPDPFPLYVKDHVHLKELIAKNLEVPENENKWDLRDPSINAQNPPKDNSAYDFLRDFVHDDLFFRAATGKEYTKDTYVWRDPNPRIQRVSAGSLRILGLQADSLLLSTPVHTGDPQHAVTNWRWFVKDESGRWTCRVWINYPDG